MESPDDLRVTRSVTRRATARRCPDAFDSTVPGMSRLAWRPSDVSTDSNGTTSVAVLPAGPDCSQNLALVVGIWELFSIACDPVAAAIHDAVGVWIRSWPFTPEKILRAPGKLPDTDGKHS